MELLLKKSLKQRKNNCWEFSSIYVGRFLDMKRSLILGTTILWLLLTGCSSTESSKPKQLKEIWPSKTSINKAIKIGNSIDKLDFGEQEQKDKSNSIRYSDILNFDKATEYTGKTKTVTGTVFDKQKVNNGLTSYYVDASTPKKSETYIIYSKPDKTIRSKDYLTIGAVIVGPARYNTKNNTTHKAVLAYAKHDEIYNNGDSDD